MFFSRSFTAMVKVGEQSGMLPASLLHIADTYHRLNMKRAKILLDIVLPLCVLALGLLVMRVEVAVFRILTLVSDALFYSL